MTNKTLNNVPRELLDSLIEQHITAHGCTTGTARKAQLLLSAPSPAGVDGLEVFAVDIQGREVVDCVRHNQHQAIIDGLRGEADQHAKRIAELEGLLIDIAGMFHGPGIEGGPLTKLLRRIDAALSAGVGRAK